MNCQDISRILDSRNANELSASERNACEAHALSCGNCGPEWVVYTRLAAIRTPDLPPDLEARCGALAAGQIGFINSRRASRMVLIGAVFVAAAAAAMLGVYITNPSPIADMAPAPLPVSQVEAIVATVPSAPESPQTSSLDEKVDPVEDAATPFTVLLLPLKDEVSKPAGKRTIASMYTSFQGLLRSTPGLQLLDPNPMASSTEPKAEYRITITGTDGFGGQVRARVEIDIVKPDGTIRPRAVYGPVVDIQPTCRSSLVDGVETGHVYCPDPEGAAAGVVRSLRTRIFPPDPTLRRQAQAQLLDRSLDGKRRLGALIDLSQFGRSPSVSSAPANGPLNDPNTILGAIDLATTASDPAVRAAVWETLRGIGNADLIQPLLVALEKDSDADVRISALGTLAGEYAEDTRVKAGFKITAERDARPLVRALARRATDGAKGTAAWKDYILVSLKDPGRSAVERLEAILFQMDLPSTQMYLGASHSPKPDPALRLLDKDAIKALAETLPRAASESSVIPFSAAVVVNALGKIDDPAVTDMLLTSLEAGSAWMNRSAAVGALGELASRRNDPSVQAMLAKLSTDDLSEEVRSIAARSLKGPSLTPPAILAAGQEAVAGAGVSASSADRRPRLLGVSTIIREAGAYVPKELIGKYVVEGVMPGSAAQKAGIVEGDIILEFDGTKNPSPVELGKLVQAASSGAELDVLVNRSGEMVRLKVQF